MSSQDLPRRSMLTFIRPLYERNFRLLFIGSLLSYVGAQLTLIAFPWLVLQLTGDSLAMGSVVAVASIPRALFMLLGGALTDRYSPKLVMLASSWLRMLLMFLLAWLVYTGYIQMWMIFVVAFLFGVIDAFSWPASSALVPRLLKTQLLTAGNSLIQGLSQLSIVMGPILAGVIISMFAADASEDVADLFGISVVFAIDGGGFVLSVIALTMIRLPAPIEIPGSEAVGNLFVSIKQGFVATWSDLPVRMITIIFSIFSLFFRGPYLIGIPVLCDTRFEDGALAFGLITSSFGAGSLLGVIIAGALPRPGEHWLGRLSLVDLFVIGLSFLVFATTNSVEIAMIASAASGFVDGYLVILLISWLQMRIPQQMMGRVMSMLMFFMQGVAPISAAVAGALIRLSLEGVFLSAGAILMGLACIGIFIPVVRKLGIDQRDHQPA